MEFRYSVCVCVRLTYVLMYVHVSIHSQLPFSVKPFSREQNEGWYLWLHKVLRMNNNWVSSHKYSIYIALSKVQEILTKIRQKDFKSQKRVTWLSKCHLLSNKAIAVTNSLKVWVTSLGLNKNEPVKNQVRAEERFSWPYHLLTNFMICLIRDGTVASRYVPSLTLLVSSE